MFPAMTEFLEGTIKCFQQRVITKFPAKGDNNICFQQREITMFSAAGDNYVFSSGR
jgi:hypothetical protein